MAMTPVLLWVNLVALLILHLLLLLLLELLLLLHLLLPLSGDLLLNVHIVLRGCTLLFRLTQNQALIYRGVYVLASSDVSQDPLVLSARVLG
jgi:hypothetical protein